MTETYASSFGLLSYKNKLLLILRDDNPQLERPNVWDFIGGEIKRNEQPETTFRREVLLSTSIKLLKTEQLVIVERDQEKHIGFIGTISDTDVNTMQPATDRQKLGFFTLTDMYRIQLAELPTIFLTDHQSVFQRLTI